MIFPEFEYAVEAEEALPEPVDVALDTKTGRLLYRSGRQYTVRGLEAIRIWIWRALKMGREFGRELYRMDRLEDYELFKERAEESLREYLMENPYISDVRDFSFTTERDAERIAFTVDTPYGAVDDETSAG